MKRELVEKVLDQMFRETCYACHNAHISPSDCTPAVLTESGWKHKSSISKTGYIACYASDLRFITMKHLGVA